jgi:hypothetical protein
MTIKPNKLKVGQKYFLINCESEDFEIVEMQLTCLEFFKKDKDMVWASFRHDFTDVEGEEDYKIFNSKFGLLNILKTQFKDKLWVENPVFATKEEAEAKKAKYILRFLKEERKIILAELANNSKKIKQFKIKKEK